MVHYPTGWVRKADFYHGLLGDRHAAGELTDHGLASLTGKLEVELERLIDRDFRNDDNRKLANHVGHELPFLFTYLKCPGLEATNWRAEQAIRPTVVARKVWGGNRTLNGAHAQEVLSSVLRTGRQRGVDPVDEISSLLRSPQPFVLSLNRPPRC